MKPGDRIPDSWSSIGLRTCTPSRRAVTQSAPLSRVLKLIFLNDVSSNRALDAAALFRVLFIERATHPAQLFVL